MAFSADISAPVTDNFHEGEFLGCVWHIREYYQGLARFPLLVHGGMDYLPALIALKLFGFEQAIVGTHIILMLLTGLQYFLLLDTCSLLIRRDNHHVFWAGLILLIFYYATPQFDVSVIEASYFPVRDLFLSLTLWCFIRCTLTPGALGRHAYLAAGAGSSALALLWCYNRGVISLALAGVFWVGLTVKRKTGSAILLLAVMLATLAVLEWLKIFGTIQENADNILYWLQYGAEINPPRFRLVYAPGIAGLVSLCLLAAAVFAVALAAHRKDFFDNDLLLFIVAGLFIVQALNIKIVFGVPDLEYALHGSWPSVMLLLFYGSRLLAIDMGHVTMKVSAFRCHFLDDRRPARLALTLAIAALLLFLAISHHHALLPYARFVKNLVRPVSNDQLLPQGSLELSRLVAESEGDCYFNWANDGVVAFLSKKKLCTDFPYVHYVAGSKEPTLQAQLEEAAPPLIVLDADLWPVTRHQERMDVRLPASYRYIAARYGHPTAIGHYQVVFRNK